MSFTERAEVFECHGEPLCGILSLPDGAAGKAPHDVAVLIVVGGPQYRAGSHRQFVSLARSLARAGYPVLRFDTRGMGDSSGAAMSFEKSGADISSAVAALKKRCPGVERVVLWGLCDGASAALLYLDETPAAPIAGLVLTNPWVRSEASLARTHVKHYYFQRLRQREFWVKALSGQVARKALADLARNVTAAVGGAKPARGEDRPFQQRMAAALAKFDGPVALMLSGNDYTAKEFLEHASGDPQWRKIMARPLVTRIDFEAADHTFSSRAEQGRLEDATAAWLARSMPGAVAGRAA
ncbi:hydrolase 1, exosortase A system-associated [soil metagenome]